MTSKNTEDKFLMYKGKPLVRCGNIIYFGNLSDKYIIMIQILEQMRFEDMYLASKVQIQLQLTDPTLKSKERVVKVAEKDGLYTAMDIASIWLDRALLEK